MPIGSQHWIQADMLSGLEELAEGVDDFAGVRFTITNRFFHAGKPLGWFRAFGIEIDGRRIDASRTTLILRDQRFSAAAVPTIADVWWQPLERLVVEVRDPAIELKASHVVACVIELPLVTFTPILDRRGIYPSDPARLEAVLPMTTPAEVR